MGINIINGGTSAVISSTAKIMLIDASGNSISSIATGTMAGYLPLTGGTMTGDIGLASGVNIIPGQSGTSNLGSTSKYFASLFVNTLTANNIVSSGDQGLYVNVTGDQMTGDLTLPRIKVGNTNTLGGTNSFVGGVSSIATGNHSWAFGNTAQALATDSHAEGNSTTANYDYSHAEGISSIASNYASHAEGDSTSATGNSSHAEGSNTFAWGNFAHAEGGATYAAGDKSHAQGTSSVASGNSAHAEGGATWALGDFSHAQGNGSIASGNYSFAAGLNARALHNNTTAFCGASEVRTTTTDQMAIRFTNGLLLTTGTSLFNNASGTQDIGSTTNYFQTLYVNSIKTTGSTAGFTWAFSETPTGSINSSNVTYTLAHAPVQTSLQLYLNGVRQVPSTDYTISSATITYITAPTTGASLLADYIW